MIDAIKRLRERTSAGVLDCKRAMKEAGGDFNKALAVLKKRGASLARKRSSRTAKQGKVASYIHMDGKIGVLVEINCETDFVAKNSDFREFCKNISMQIAASNPQYVKKEDMPKGAIDRDDDICLLEQPYIKDPNTKVKELLTSLIAKIGENIVIRRFVRYQLGEE